jgi:hypothetical protein
VGIFPLPTSRLRPASLMGLVQQTVAAIVAAANL